MKKGFLIMLVATFCAVGARAQDVSSYLNDYGKFVSKVTNMAKISDVDRQPLDSAFEKFTAEYHDTYKVKMTNSQIAKYMELRTRYKRKMAIVGSGKVTDKIDSVGNKAVNGIKRTGSKISGAVKGLFGKDK